MKILKIVLSVLITVGLLICAILFYQYEHNYKKASLIQKIRSTTAFSSKIESPAQRQAEATRNYRLIVLEQLKKGNVDAAATIGPTKEVEDQILTMLQGPDWFGGVGMVHGLLFDYKWPPDRFSMKIRDALVDVLTKELKAWKPPYSVGQSGSDKDLLTQDVCTLYNPRSIPLLIKLNMTGCLSLYGNVGAGIVLSTTASLWMPSASTEIGTFRLTANKIYAMQSLGGFTNSPTVWNSLSPDIQRKIKAAIYDGIKDKDSGVRIWAIQALVPIADKQDVNTLKEIYYKDPDKGPYSVREEAEKALTERAFLWNLLDKHTQENIRNNIYQKLKDKDWGIRLKGVKELSYIADKNDIPILEKLSKDPVSYVSEVANKTLESLKEKGNE